MRAIIVILLLGLSACTSFKSGGWLTMDLGEFTLTLPKGSILQPQQSIDSYIAKIKGEGFEFIFDYGAYSPKLTLTPKEYIEMQEWHKDDSFGPLFSILEPRPTLESVVAINDSTFLATYKAKDCIESDSCYLNIDRKLFTSFLTINDSTIEYEIKLPKELMQHEFFVTTTDSTFKRVFIPKELNNYEAGVYLINKNSCMEDNEFHCWKQLALWTSDSVNIGKRELKKILKSVELK